MMSLRMLVVFGFVTILSTAVFAQGSSAQQQTLIRPKTEVAGTSGPVKFEPGTNVPKAPHPQARAQVRIPNVTTINYVQYPPIAGVANIPMNMLLFVGYLDTNGNRSIDRREFPEDASLAFSRLDLNGNGQATMEEILRALAPQLFRRR